MNKATEIALGIIAEKEQKGIVPTYATWLEVYLKAGAFDMNGEQMTRQLNAGITAGYLTHCRGLNGELYGRGENGNVSRI